VEVFLHLGGQLALTASQRAITDWGRPDSEITHLICTTCTGSSHPGYDLFLHQQLGLGPEVERTLIHGIGCAGGLAIVRLARNVCIAMEAQGRKARVLVVALEVTSTLVRTELQAVDEESERGGTRPNVASTIFSDAASAMVVGSGELLEDGELRG
jgi:type III polyketide synthase